MPTGNAGGELNGSTITINLTGQFMLGGVVLSLK